MFAHSNAERFEDANWVILGIPSEIGSFSKVKNYLEGPEAIRDGSYRIFEPVLGNLDGKYIFDYGDLEVEDIKDLGKTYEIIYKELERLYCKDKKFVFLGGDHSITYPIIKIIKKNWEDFYLLFFDAHPDCHPDEYPNYQSFIYYLVNEGFIEPEKIIMVGVSNWSKEEKEFILENKINYYTPIDIWKDVNKVSEEILEILEGKDVYLSIDLDVFDTGCGHWLEPLGIRPYHYFEIMKSLSKNINLISFDIVELYPQEFCENLAAKLIIETISMF